ncbi:MAG: hypothetical protein ACPKNR_10025 [Pleomorphochaeta sp.]
MRKNIFKKSIISIILIAIGLLITSCELNFTPNEILYETTSYGTVCMQDNEVETAFLLSIPNEKLFFLEYVKKMDCNEMLISKALSNDTSKFYVLIGNSNRVGWDPYGIGLFVFDLENPQNNTYKYSPLIQHALNPIVKITNRDISKVILSNDSITYTERSGNEVTIAFNDISF